MTSVPKDKFQSFKSVSVVTLICLSLGACTPGVPRSGEGESLAPGVIPGKTTVADADAAMGRPVSTRESRLEGGVEVREYPGEVSANVRDGKVEQVRGRPGGNAAHIQYWLHEYRGEKTRRIVDPSAAGSDPHATKLEQLIVPERGRTIQFESDSGRVIQVFEYAPIVSRGASR
jgi:hypothetical protein